MEPEDAYEMTRAINRVANALGMNDINEGSVVEQICQLAKATDRIANALNRIADVMEAKNGN
jgi:Holliday junction resolvasome RuvABC ATP-dependent DNA helicase subunit